MECSLASTRRGDHHAGRTRIVYEGRSREQKREIAEVITDALVRIAGSKREAVNVLFDNHTKDDWVIGGAPEYANPDQST